MKNINIELFKRYAPAKKIEIINKLTADELFSVSAQTIVRIIKEAGVNMYKSRDKRLIVDRDRRAGNNWNSHVEEISLCKNNVFLGIYVQMDDTDTTESVPWTDFMRVSEYRGTCYECNRYGDDVPHYFRYGRENKAEVIKSFLLEYVYTKYADKLR